MMLRKIHVTGVVQGVGFRPFVYQMATRAGLNGWVVNTSAGVDIEIEGDETALDAFLRGLTADKPPLARIDEVRVVDAPSNGRPQFDGFEIRASVAVPGAFQPISPDISICPDCLRELFDPADRRYLYPFINCTNCGPRFTIVQDIPYDRPKTTMSVFPMCDDCAREYRDPLNRRFHAQPVACPRCGPQVWLERGAARVGPAEAIAATRQLLAEGRIVAVKGLGGFHLACDATNAQAVAELRHRKLRVDKPFALMMRDAETVERYCFLSDAERALLESRERPIVLLRVRPGAGIAEQVAPRNADLGVMLPYTPLHYLLLTDLETLQAAALPALVMTSGNLSEEPIATDNAEARSRLAGLADAFLMHDREIRTRCDDSVMRVFARPAVSADEGPASTDYPVRRSRGYAPYPVRLPFDAPPLLAAGAELKNTFCITRDRYAFLSHHIGDMENYETLRSFEDGVAHFERLFRVTPQAVAYDLHPNYLATRYALERAEREKLPAVGVQHHHAHIAAGMAEHGLDAAARVIGVAFDGTGYGDDGAIWGGEILIAGYRDFQRAFHLDYVPLPGGDKAVREPWRIALAWLRQAGLPWSDDLECVRAASEQVRRVVASQIERGTNAPPTSSMGRLFDAVAALADVRQTVNFEAQAAMELETLVEPGEAGAYEFGLWASAIDAAPVIAAIVKDIRAGVTRSKIAARFHNGVAEMTRQVCRLVRGQSGLNQVVLSGGVWQNLTLLAGAVERLERDGFVVYVHRLVPANDGGLALGQAAIAAARLTMGNS